MGATIDINKKSNVKQNTAGDLINSQLNQPVIARYEATSSLGQTTINLPFLVDQSNTDAFDLFVDGRLLRIGASNDFTFSAIDGTNSSSTISLGAPLSANLNIIAIKRGLKKELEFQTDSRFQQGYDLYASTFQGFVDESARLTAISGAPSSSQFRTFGIVNRASIPDIANDLRARMGIDRIPVQQIIQLQTEFGPNGEQVFGALNDDRNLIRFVGNFSSSVTGNGTFILGGANTTDYVEVVFYGTGLNILQNLGGSGYDLRVTVDGGSEGGNVTAGTYSTVLQARNYNTNQPINVASNLSLGIHTVRIRQAASSSLFVYGFEVLNESASVNLRPGTAYQNGKKLVLSSASNIAPASGPFDSVLQSGSTTSFSSTRGARVVEYIKSDGTRGKSAYLTNSTQGNLASADHTYEEVVRRYSFREFGAGRSDDFSSLPASGNNTAAFTLEDGTTTLVGSVINSSNDAINFNGVNAFFTLTFVGTGLDIISFISGGSESFTTSIDGSASVGTTTVTNTTPITRKIVSGLPYGTHTVKIAVVGTPGTNLRFTNFIVYQPKKPSIPAGAVELADYNVMADFSANAVATYLNVSTGVLRKQAIREAAYIGTFLLGGVDPADSAGNYTYSSTNGDSVRYTFFGTGFDYRFYAATANYNFTIAVDGSTNLSGFTTGSTLASGMSFTASTGTVSGTPASPTYGNSVRVQGLTLGLHTVVVTRGTQAATFFQQGAIDIITPIHSPKSSFQADLQNTLPVGSQGLSDSRRLSAVKSEDPKKFRAVAVGISNSTNTSGTFVPMADMSLTVTSPGAWFSVDFDTGLSGSGGGTAGQIGLYVNGQLYGAANQHQVAVAGYQSVLSFSRKVYLARGTHKLDIYWQGSGGTLTVYGNSGNLGRQLSVVEL
jgi:hypothetical protein